MYPLLTVNIPHLRENIRVLMGLCKEHGIKITAVTKVFRGDPIIARALAEEGIEILGDARIDNLAKMSDIAAEKWLIRPPMISEVSRLVQFADASLNSEIETVYAIDEEARIQEKIHKIILMADLGDIREGYVDTDELLEAAKKVAAMKNVELYGIGVNLTCFSFVQYDSEKLTQLADLGKSIENEIGIKLNVISGGNSATVHLMMQGGIPEGVNNLRLGESILFGKERAKYQYLPKTHSDVFTLKAEIVELKEKPSLPWGEIGVDSYGNKPEFIDRGEKRMKAICALGRQDFDAETTVPCDTGIIILGASSDHLMLDVTDSDKTYKVGDTVEFKLGYFSTMRAFTSEYVHKEYIYSKNNAETQ